MRTPKNLQKYELEKKKRLHNSPDKIAPKNLEIP